MQDWPEWWKDGWKDGWEEEWTFGREKYTRTPTKVHSNVGINKNNYSASYSNPDNSDK